MADRFPATCGGDGQAGAEASEDAGSDAGGDGGAEAAGDNGAEDAGADGVEVAEDAGAEEGAGNKRRRCAACYQAAGDRRLAQKVKKVTTRCCLCGKAFCLPHMRLYCNGCNMAEERPPLQQQQPLLLPRLDQTVERQQLEIEQLRHQLMTVVCTSFLNQGCGSGSSCVSSSKASEYHIFKLWRIVSNSVPDPPGSVIILSRGSGSQFINFVPGIMVLKLTLFIYYRYLGTNVTSSHH